VLGDKVATRHVSTKESNPLGRIYPCHSLHYEFLVSLVSGAALCAVTFSPAIRVGVAQPPAEKENELGFDVTLNTLQLSTLETKPSKNFHSSTFHADNYKRSLILRLKPVGDMYWLAGAKQCFIKKKL
jgi:hypothetical protein